MITNKEPTFGRLLRFFQKNQLLWYQHIMRIISLLKHSLYSLINSHASCLRTRFNPITQKIELIGQAIIYYMCSKYLQLNNQIYLKQFGPVISLSGLSMHCLSLKLSDYLINLMIKLKNLENLYKNTFQIKKKQKFKLQVVQTQNIIKSQNQRKICKNQKLFNSRGSTYYSMQKVFCIEPIYLILQFESTSLFPYLKSFFKNKTSENYSKLII
ncbi:unnamed protein product [Paramecium primaurelia]|uniref:Uncharacterized protein n=1 Tax=Paramecium primaurelia TaxID=5886 RepID=A0A8S1QG19_PARPR|nr:unnamed protein product [Paramecium primaurelia]